MTYKTKKPISSTVTMILKFFISPIGLAAMTYGIYYQLGLHEPSKIMITLFCLGILVLYTEFVRLKRITMDDKYLYVSNYLKEIKIERSNIKKVSDNHPFTKRVYVQLKEKSAFGRIIVFIPKTSYRDLVWSFKKPEVIKELENSNE